MLLLLMLMLLLVLVSGEVFEGIGVDLSGGLGVHVVGGVAVLHVGVLGSGELGGGGGFGCRWCWNGARGLRSSMALLLLFLLLPLLLETRRRGEEGLIGHVWSARWEVGELG